MIEVLKTTDGKYVGLVVDIDPRNPPSAIPAGDGAVFNPLWWRETSPGIWRVWNHNYTVILREK